MAAPTIENKMEDKIVNRLKAEGQLTRNRGSNSIKKVISSLDNIFNLLVKHFDTTVREAAVNKFALEEKLAEEKRKKDEAKGKGLRGAAGAVGKGIGAAGRGIGAVGKGIGAAGGFLSSLISMLAGPALLLFLFKLPEILESKTFKNALTFIKEELIPLGEKFYNGVLIPLKDQIGIFFGKSFEDIKTFIETLNNDISEDFAKGDILKGSKKLGTSLKDTAVSIADNLATSLYNFFAEIFKFEKTDSAFGEAASQYTKLKEKAIAMAEDLYKTLKDIIKTFTIAIIAALPTEFLRSDIGKRLGLTPEDLERVEDLRSETTSAEIKKQKEKDFGDPNSTLEKQIIGLPGGELMMAMEKRLRAEIEKDIIQAQIGDINVTKTERTSITSPERKLKGSIDNNLIPSWMRNIPLM